MTKDKDIKDDDVEVETTDAGDPEVEGRLATGVAPAWATDPTTNKNAAQKFV